MSATDAVAVAPDRSAAEPATAAARRSWTSRLSTGHVVMIVAGILAAVANYSLLTSQDDRTMVLAAAGEIPPGTVITAELFEEVPVGVGGAAQATLLRPADLDAVLGEVTTTAISAGGLVRRDDLIAPSSQRVGHRRMSLPVAPQHAVAGEIRPADLIDVVHVVDGRPLVLAAGVEVLAVGDDGGGALTGGNGFTVTVSVDADTALCLAAALDTGEVHLLLSTGQDPVAAPGCLASS